MGLPYQLLLKTNGWFPQIVHPFNLQNDGEKTYAMWQYEKGYDTIRLYMDRYTKEEIIAALEKNGFTVLEAEGFLGEDETQSDRLCFLAQKGGKK